MKHYPASFYSFVKTLPKELDLLKVLLDQYRSLQDQLIYLINNPCPLVCIHYLELQPELLTAKSKKLFLPSHLTTQSLKAFLEDYSNLIFAQRAMLEEYIEDLELEKKQSLFN